MKLRGWRKLSKLLHNTWRFTKHY